MKSATAIAVLAWGTSLAFSSVASGSPAADLNGDGRVDRGDLGVIRAAFYGNEPRADLDGDGVVNFADLAILRHAVDEASGRAPTRRIAGTELPAVSLLPAAQDVDLAQSLTLELWMDFSVEPTLGGGVDIAYDPQALEFQSFVFEDIGDPAFRREPDLSPGLLSALAFGDFDGLTGPALVATLTLRALQPGSTDVVPSDTANPVIGSFVSDVDFQPMEVGYFAALVNVNEVPLPAIALSPASLIFPDTPVTWESTIDLLVSNDGDANLDIGQIGTLLMLDSPFSFVVDDCSLRALVPAQSCTVRVTFAPFSATTFTDEFDIPSNDPFEPSVIIGVSGNGLPAPPAGIEVSPATLDFPNTVIGMQAVADVTVSSVGEGDLTIPNVSLEGSEAFTILGEDCVSQILPLGESCTVSVAFVPIEVGAAGDTLRIASNAPDSVTMIAVSGFGLATAAPSIAIDPGTLALPNARLAQGTFSTLAISNAGGADLVLGDIALADPLDAPFAVLTDACSGQTLASFESCALTVVFTPTELGLASDTFDLPSNDPATPSLSVDVSGRGVTIGIQVIGAPPAVGRCGNLTTGQQFDFGPGGQKIDCEQAGLTAASGERVSVSAIGQATGSALSVLFAGVEDRGLIARCRNWTTGQRITFVPRDPIWSCTDEGLAVSPGDIVIVVARGDAL